jgi:hypothetical protein
MRKTPVILLVITLSLIMPFTQITKAAAPTITTNNATGVQETNATLQGTLTADGGKNCAVGFNYGPTTSYGTNTTTSNYTTYPGIISSIHLFEGEGVGDFRTAIKITGFNSIPLTATFYLAKTGVLTGSIYARIRYVSNDTIYDSVSIDASTISSSYAYKTFTFTKLAMLASDIYVSIEYYGGGYWDRLYVSTAYSLGSGYVYSNWGEIDGWENNNYPPTINFTYTDPYTTGNTFNYSLTGLTQGTLYHYRAYAINTDGRTNGADSIFLTKPLTPTNLLITANTSTTNYLTWTKGTGANNTRIQRNASNYPHYPTTISNGTNTYNNTDDDDEDTPLSPGMMYYYKAFSFTIWGALSKWADTNTTQYCLTRPNGPTAGLLTPINSTTINLSWTLGTGRNTTIIRRSTTGSPTTPQDGTEIYNSTGNYTITTTTIGLTYYYRAWSYTTWTTPTAHTFSTGTISFIGGGMYFSVYNETNPAQALTNWTIEIKNLNASEVHVDNDCNNILFLNSSLMPQGEVTIRIGRQGYRERIVYTTILTGVFYTDYFYLPSLTNPDPYGNTSSTSLFTDTVTITSTFYSVNKVIPLSYTLKTLYAVEVYNKSISSGYGGWMPVPTIYYTINTNNTITISHLILASNTTYARAIYYYETTAGTYTPPQIYYCQVVETSTIGDSQTFQPVENAYVTIKRYINTTDAYEILSVLKTDAYGKVNLWLFPSQIYLVSISCNGYNDKLADYIPAPANIYGQTELEIFRITRQTGGINMPDYYTLFTNITYTLEPRGTRHTGSFTVYYNITSMDNMLEWYRLDIYRQPYNSSTWTLIHSTNQSNPGGGSISYTIPNQTGRYSIECWFKKTGYPAYEIYNTGSIIHFIINLRTTMNLIPDEAYMIITIVLMLVGMGACALYFTTGPITGYVGLGIMAFMLFLHNDVTINTGITAMGSTITMSGWVIFGITFLIYTSALFLWSRL